MDEWVHQLRERAEVKTYIDRIPEAQSEEAEEASEEEHSEESSGETEPEE